MPNYQLILAKEAETDLENIYIDGFTRWGETQADSYYSDIISHFDMLCENPYLFRAVPEIREGYRRSVCGKHTVFYRIVDETIEIMALLRCENRFSISF